MLVIVDIVPNAICTNTHSHRCRATYWLNSISTHFCAIDMENERLAAWRITYYMQFDPFDAYYSRVIERRTDSGREREKNRSYFMRCYNAFTSCVNKIAIESNCCMFSLAFLLPHIQHSSADNVFAQKLSTIQIGVCVVLHVFSRSPDTDTNGEKHSDRDTKLSIVIADCHSNSSWLNEHASTSRIVNSGSFPFTANARIATMHTFSYAIFQWQLLVLAICMRFHRMNNADHLSV